MRFLVVEDQPTVASAVARVLRVESDGGSVDIVGTLPDARRAVAQTEYDGITLDVGLPGGCGIDLLDAMLAKPKPPGVLVLSATVDRELLRRARWFGAEYVVKPAGADDIRLFVERTRLRRLDAGRRVRDVLSCWIERYGLSAAECEILLERASGRSRAAIGAARAVSGTTIKKQVHVLMKKTGDGSLNDAVSRLLREALELT